MAPPVQVSVDSSGLTLAPLDTLAVYVKRQTHIDHEMHRKKHWVNLKGCHSSPITAVVLTTTAQVGSN
jgi:hypothetical protein